MDSILGWLLPLLLASDQMQIDLAVLERIMSVDKEDLCRILA